MWVSFFLLIIKDVGRLEDAQNRLAIKQLIKEVGEPRNYGLTDEEKAEEERKAAEERLAREALEEAEREHKEAVETAEKVARWEEWVSVRTCVGSGCGGVGELTNSTVTAFLSFLSTPHRTWHSGGLQEKSFP